MPITTPASTRRSGRPRSRRRPPALMLATVLLVGAAAACDPAAADTDPPRWTIGGKPVETALGPHVTLSWPAATGDPTRYRIDVNGVSATMLTTTATSCVMVGLAASTAYSFKITAYDAAGNWSGSLPDSMEPPGYRVANHTTPAGAGGGPTLRCVPVTDTDGDRLPDTLETGTGTYAHTASTGTVLSDADSDDDGLRDGDEVLGASNGLDLPALGVRPTSKDILLELDWATSPACPIDMRPRATWIDPIVAAFARMPIESIGADGIKLIVDYGQGGVLNGGNAVPDDDGRLQGVGAVDPKPLHFSPQREGYFHYGSIGSRVKQGSEFVGGLGDLGGDDVWFGFGCQDSEFNDHSRSFILMHELGHNLDLNHGGHESRNDKPNYGSIMNYRYMVTGADVDCDGWGDGTNVFRFSEEERASIDENAIDETAGVCGVPMDIDGDAVIDPGIYAADVSRDGARTVLTGADDMDLIDVGAFAAWPRTHDEVISDPLP